MNLDPLRDTTEAAAFLRRSKRTLETWRVKGGGPRYVKAGGRALYRVEDLLAFVETNLRDSTSDRGRGGAELEPRP